MNLYGPRRLEVAAPAGWLRCHPRLVGLVLLAVVTVLAGCASTSGSDGMLDKALQAVGLQKPAPPALPAVPESLPALPRPPQPTQLPVRLHASEVLNTDSAGQSLSVVARVYVLRDTTAFLQAPYESFREPATGKESSFSKDVVSSREVILVPGARHETLQEVPAEGRAVAVLALFRSPAPGRWRFAFDTKASAAEGGITVGVHGCALSVAQGRTIEALPDAQRLAGVRCR